METDYVYIMATKTGTLYTGMTNDLQKRVFHHNNKTIEGFTQKYDVSRLAYFEETNDVNTAIARKSK